MKLPVVFKDLLIISSLAVAITLVISVQGFSQDKKEPGKDDEKTITLKIIKDDNGKVTVIDTTITTEGNGKELQYEYTIRDLNREMEGFEDQMREMVNCEDVFIPCPPMSPQFETLLQSIPMGKITGFQVKDRKGGKRIIIDIDDEAPVMIMAPYRHRGHSMGPKRIIIERDMDDMQVPPPPPPPPPADQPREPAPKPDKG
jgi:hypothetical protein